jgi:hypothetical protein
MANQIKRNYWSRFFKKFNSANQYRRAKLTLTQDGRENGPTSIGPFMGLALHKKGRLIDGVQFLSGDWDINSVAKPVVTVREPENIWLEKDEHGRDSYLRVQSADGTEIRLDLEGEKQQEQERYLVEKIAYSMFERRGYGHGNDMGDWFEAERRVRQTEGRLTG